MMSDPKAILGWGFEIERWSDGTPDWLNEKDYEGLEWEDRYADAKGLTPIDYGEPGYDGYAKERAALVKLAGCVLFDHDEETGPMLVAVAASVVKGDWDALTRVDIDGLAGLNPQQCEGWLRSFCEVLEIPWREPQWFLTSYAI